MDALFPETSPCGWEVGRDESALERVVVSVSSEPERGDCTGADGVSMPIAMAI